MGFVKSGDSKSLGIVKEIPPTTPPSSETTVVDPKQATKPVEK